MGEKYLKSETVNPAFEAEEGAAQAGRGAGPAGPGTGGGALARGDDFERLRVEPAVGAKGVDGGTPKGGKGLTPRRGGGAAAAAAGGGALGALMGRKKVRLLTSMPLPFEGLLSCCLLSTDLLI